MFTAGEKAFLRDLARDPTWAGILDKLEHGERSIPAYQPSKGDPVQQASDWQFRSGVDRGRRDLLKLLSDG